MNRERVTNILTAAVIGVWIVAALVKPGAAQILSPVVMLIIGYWFRQAGKNGAENGAKA